MKVYHPYKVKDDTTVDALNTLGVSYDTKAEQSEFDQYCSEAFSFNNIACFTVIIILLVYGAKKLIGTLEV